MTLGSFALDKFEVTVGRFRAFVAAYAGGWRPAVGSGANPNVTAGDTSWRAEWDDSWGAGYNLPRSAATAAATWRTFAIRLKCADNQTWTDASGANETKPINCVNWHEAFAFCIWDGGRLPTEAEWEYAAAGGAENRLFPWGSAAPDCTYANSYDGNFCTGTAMPSALPVGSTPKGDGRWGQADLAGNVQEWALDWYGSYSMAQSNNYANVVPGLSRVFRGGYFSGGVGYLSAAWRQPAPPNNRYGFVGLRCARTP